jgi:cytochrome P450
VIGDQTVALTVDLADPGVHAHPEALTSLFSELRMSGTAAWCGTVPERPGFWVLSRREHVIELCRQRDSFISSRGNVLDTLLAGGDSAGGRMLAVSDGSRHTRLRSALRSSFTEEGLRTIAASIARQTDALVQAVVGGGECDIAGDVAEHIPLAAICDLLGIPVGDREDLLQMTRSALSVDSAVGEPHESRRARIRLLHYFARLLQSGERGRSELMGTLLGMRDVDESFGDDEVIFNCYSIILGGDETTRLAMIGAVKALAEHPGEFDSLRAGRIDRDVAVEELLRWTTPAMHVGRTAVTDSDLFGARIQAGEIVTGWLTSANDDEDEFDNPTELDLGRRPNRHLTFSHGHHFCLGAALARVEMRSLVDALCAHVSRIELLGEPTSIYSNFLAGFSELRVNLSPSNGGMR